MTSKIKFRCVTKEQKKSLKLLMKDKIDEYLNFSLDHIQSNEKFDLTIYTNNIDNPLNLEFKFGEKNYVGFVIYRDGSMKTYS